jgi:hypothetical protein
LKDRPQGRAHADVIDGGAHQLAAGGEGPPQRGLQDPVQLRRQTVAAAMRVGVAASTLARRPATNAGTMRDGSMNSRAGVASTASMSTCASSAAYAGWSRKRARTSVADSTGRL